MEEELNKMKVQWHPAFCSVMQIELEAYGENLQYIPEYLLGKKPMQMDLLITKTDAIKVITKNIGRIFKAYNVMEYKSPTDYFSVDKYYKVI